MYTTVSIVLGFEEILKWTMFQVYPEYTFSKLLEVALAKSTCSFVDENMYSECKGYLSNDIKLSTRVEVPLEFSVIECCEANGNCVRFIFTVLAEPTSPSYRNAAEVLMSSARSQMKHDANFRRSILCTECKQSGKTERTRGVALDLLVRKEKSYV